MNQTILVTGAATGIGALSAVSLAKAGHTDYASMPDPAGRNVARVEDRRRRSERVRSRRAVSSNPRRRANAV
jgi:NAD(P)-dependent dehydrogenase (short-subunit alcohol dehydrogenase family)